MDTYALEKLTGWTPELSPPPDSPLFRWRVLAFSFSPCGRRCIGGLWPPSKLTPMLCIGYAKVAG